MESDNELILVFSPSRLFLPAGVQHHRSYSSKVGASCGCHQPGTYSEWLHRCLMARSKVYTLACPGMCDVALLSVSCTRGHQCVTGAAMYLWCPGWLSWQSHGCSGSCWCRWDGWERWWKLHFLALHPAALLALPPRLCKPIRRKTSSLHLSHPMPRAASAGSLFILVPVSAVKKSSLAVSHWCVLIICFLPVFLSFG